MFKKMVSILMITGVLFCNNLKAEQMSQPPEFSVAGYFSTPERNIQSLNVGWRFHKGDIKDAYACDFNDKNWEVVTVPHGIELLPMNASGCHNYQGVVWYRKHFTPSIDLKGKKLFLHFEAVMGKCKVFLNGKLLKEHFGGYLPFSVDVTHDLELGKENVIAVWADNSDDTDYPPGKTQVQLDFSYLGGIYRDVYLIAHAPVYVTEATYEDQVAGGGVFVSYRDVSEKAAKVDVRSEIKNEEKRAIEVSVEYILSYKNDLPLKVTTQTQTLAPNTKIEFKGTFDVINPKLWSPETPNLYTLNIYVKEAGKIRDHVRRKVGIRSIEFKAKNGGFWLNGKPYGKPLIGGNRHQDFAVIGNAVPNSIHYRDAKKMRDIGMKVVRNAHCPQDPAFMDACDELGLFVIVNTPGWQFWSDKPIFGKRVKDDIRQMVRRDRNHACVWLWEPVLNETWYPSNAAKEWNDIIYEEYPYAYCYTASDYGAKGSEFFPVLFPHPVKPGSQIHALEKTKDQKTYFTREWGDCVDNWNSHNSPSRVHIAWGEGPQLQQAIHYSSPNYPVTSINSLHQVDTEYVGGSLWHTFDHQRGYHPDPFYGGVFDAFRMPKYSSYMFKSQQDPKEVGGVVFIAHEMTPFSPNDVSVFSNCDSILLTVYYGNENNKVIEYARVEGKKEDYKSNNTIDELIVAEIKAKGIRYPMAVFKDVFSHWKDKMAKDQRNTHIKAEGYLNGKLAATHIVKPARRPSKILLWLDDENVPLQADGSDMVTVVAAISDADGNIKKLNNDYVQFSIEGEGHLIGGADIMANPKKFEFGKAPILVRSTTKPGKIKIVASLRYEGRQKATPAVIEFESIPSKSKQLFEASEASKIGTKVENSSTQQLKTDAEREVERLQKELNALKLKEVEKQQDAFGEFR